MKEYHYPELFKSSEKNCHEQNKGGAPRHVPPGGGLAWGGNFSPFARRSKGGACGSILRPRAASYKKGLSGKDLTSFSYREKRKIGTGATPLLSAEEDFSEGG